MQVEEEMGDLGAGEHGSQQALSLVSMFDELMIKQEETRREVNKTGPEYFLKVLEVSARSHVSLGNWVLGSFNTHYFGIFYSRKWL